MNINYKPVIVKMVAQYVDYHNLDKPNGIGSYHEIIAKMINI